MRPSTLRAYGLGIVAFSLSILVLKVHHDRRELEPNYLIDFDATTQPPAYLHTCSQELRKVVMEETCKLAKKKTSNFGLRNDNNIKILVTDDKKKVLYCVMAKTGTKSWLHYLVSVAGKVSPGQWHFRKTDFMEKAGLTYRRNVAVKEMNTKYKGYFKFIVARHPLQRLASAYYEAILKAERYNKRDGTAPNFTEFSSRLEADLAPQLHWSLYQDECQICKVKYDYIVKTETIDDDSAHLNELLDTNVNLTVRHTNILYDDAAPTDYFKYDHMYQEVYRENQDALRTALRVYHNDMRTLGYQWDWHQRRSKCENDDGKGGHCC